jgi:membrane-associated protease RseP (regulator of RpoE activity)
MKRSFGLISLGAGVVVGLLAAAAMAAPVDSPRWLSNGFIPRPSVTLIGDDALIADPPAEPSDYWLGIECYPVPAMVQAQLKLPERQGLLVDRVAPNSPAAKAGIEQYDILLRAGDKVLAEPRDLVRTVQAAKEAKLTIELIRGGQHQTIEAVPAKRPEEARRPLGAMPAPGDWETMQKWLDQMRREQGVDEGDGRGPMHFRLLRPGAILPNALAELPLPGNMSISVSKEGDQPAKIVVKRGDEKWEVTEKELDKLPADVRPHVEHMLGHGGLVGALERAVPAPPPGVHNDPAHIAPEPWEGRLEKRLEAMDRRIERLLRAVEEMTGSHAQPKAPEEHGDKEF